MEIDYILIIKTFSLFIKKYFNDKKIIKYYLDKKFITYIKHIVYINYSSN